MGDFNNFGGQDPMYDAMSSIVPLFFILVFGVIIFTFVKGIGEWASNNKKPIIPVDATIVSKRLSVSHSSGGADNMHSSSHTTYYVTFQFKNGERAEFCVNGREYGLLAEGDQGILSFQGTRYIDFKRNI